MDTPPTAPEFLRRLIDDAAIFPPGNVPLPDAVRAHGNHHESEYADLVGTFVVSDGRLPELCDLVADSSESLAISLVVTGGAGALTGAVTWATRAPQIELAGLEIALRDPVESGELAHNARRIVAALDDSEVDIPVYVEMPRVPDGPGAGWLAGLDVLAERELNAKFRLGGVEPGMVPTSSELAAVIAAALDREVAFKCTAGLHQAIRHGDGAEAQHGFLNVLVATRTELDGGDTVAALEERDAAALLAAADHDALARTRRWFRSFGSCSILEPHHDLVELELM